MPSQTTNYSMFKLKDDNRKPEESHIKRLMASIQSRNLLEFRPILVNSQLEIIDGQHRLESAKRLQLPIFYEIQSSLKASDIIQLNVAKSWTASDYLNYYVKNEYPEYIKFKQFQDKNGLSTHVALNMCIESRINGYKQFRDGQFVFNEQFIMTEISVVWQTINIIKKCNPSDAHYTSTSRFWTALLRLIRHPDFQEHAWINNAARMVDDFMPKGRVKDYIKLFIRIYNYRNSSKINMVEETTDI